MSVPNRSIFYATNNSNEEKNVKNSFEGNQNNYKIEIIPTEAIGSEEINELKFEGYLNNEISFNIPSNWESGGGILDMIPSSKIFETGKKFASTSGKTIANSGAITRKFYQGSDYLTFNINCRVVDEEANGLIMEKLSSLILFTLPRLSSSIDFITLGKKAIKKLKNSGGNEDDKNKEENSSWNIPFTNLTKEEVIKKIKKSANEVLSESQEEDVQEIIKSAKDYIKEVGKNIEVTEAPPPVSINIGYWFSHQNMVIDDLNITFSKELTKYGPLFADFDISVSSREKMVLEDLGEDEIPVRNLNFPAYEYLSNNK